MASAAASAARLSGVAVAAVGRVFPDAAGLPDRFRVGATDCAAGRRRPQPAAVPGVPKIVPMVSSGLFPHRRGKSPPAERDSPLRGAVARSTVSGTMSTVSFAMLHSLRGPGLVPGGSARRPDVARHRARGHAGLGASVCPGRDRGGAIRAARQPGGRTRVAR